MAVVGVRNVAALVSASMPTPSPATSLTTMASAPLRQQLGAAIFHAVLSLGGKADDELAGPAAAHHFGKNVFSGREFERQRTAALELLLGDSHGPVVGHGRGLDHQRGLVHARQARRRASRRRW